MEMGCTKKNYDIYYIISDGLHLPPKEEMLVFNYPYQPFSHGLNLPLNILCPLKKKCWYLIIHIRPLAMDLI